MKAENTIIYMFEIGTGLEPATKNYHLRVYQFRQPIVYPSIKSNVSIGINDKISININPKKDSISKNSNSELNIHEDIRPIITIGKNIFLIY